MAKCSAVFVGYWSGDTDPCVHSGTHLYHRTLGGWEWVNDDDYCATSLPGTVEVCRKAPEHKGLCRVRLHGKVIDFRITDERNKWNR